MGLPVLPFGTPLEGQAASDWAIAILHALGAPITEANVFSFAGWFRREGGGGENNPMNTTLGSQYPAINSDGVRNFPTPDIGVAETVATLEHGYSAIVESFRAGAGLEHPNSETAAELHLWSGGGYSFIEPVAVPMPPAPSFHYDRFDGTIIDLANDINSERRVVENYDRFRPHPVLHARDLRQIHQNLVFLADRIESNMRTGGDPHGVKFDRAWRLAQIRERIANRIVEPS